MALDVVIMAAGKGTRMKSSMPKVLHPLGGKALVQHVIDTAQQLQARQTVVITGHEAEQVEAALQQHNPGLALHFARQMPQLGTGHAVQQAVPYLPDDGVVVILSGDVPLTQAATLQALMQACAGHHLALLTIEFADPKGYGRIVREGGQARHSRGLQRHHGRARTATQGLVVAFRQSQCAAGVLPHRYREIRGC